MYRFNTAIGTFELPSGYHELTVKQLKFIQENIENEGAILQMLTGFDVIKLSMLDLSDFGNYLDFMQQPLHEIELLDFIKDVDLSFDFGERTFGEKIKASQYLIDGDVYGMLSVYSGLTDFDFMFVSDVFGAVNYVISQLRTMDEERAKMLAYTPTMEEVMAGINNFDELGEFNTIDTIAKDYGYKHKEVEELEYNLVILILYRAKISANFERKLINVRQNTGNS